MHVESYSKGARFSERGSQLCSVERTSPKIILIAAVVAVTVLFLDLSLPSGIASAVPYVVLVFLGTWFSMVRQIYALAALGSALTVVGFLASPAGAAFWLDAANHGLALFTIWITAFLVAARKKAEEPLRQEKNHLLSLITSSPSISYACKASGNYATTYISENVTNIIGFRPQAFLNDPDFWADGIHPDDAPRVFEDLKQLFEHGSHSHEYRFRKPDGSYIWMEDNLNLISDSDGSPKEIVGLWADITKRRAAKSELTKTKNKLKDTIAQLGATFEATADGILVVDGQGKIKNYNIRFVELWKLPDTIVSSRDDEKAIHFVLDQLTDPQAFLDKVNELYAAPEKISFDLLDFKDGRIFERYSRPQKIEERIVGRVWSFRDVTEIETSRRDLVIAKTEAERANKAKSEFLSSMSHELRTPMNAILGFTQMLQFDPLTESQNDAVENILRGGDHLLVLIEQVLELAKIEAGHLSLNVDHIPTRTVIDNSLNLIQARAARDGIKIIDRIDGTDLPFLWTDSTRLTQVLLNLLSNAVKYNCENGTVTLTYQERPGRKLRISVADTGPGIAAEKHGDLFKPFERLGRETGAIEGTGIGLAIARQIIEVLGGQVGFESEEDKGSTFWVDVPMSARKDADAVNAETTRLPGKMLQHQVEDGSRFTVLYVEDNPDNMQLMEMMIGRIANTKLVTAYNAELGIDLAKSEQPDLILMDINLPGINGIEALKHLRDQEETKDIPVIAITARAMPRDVAVGGKAGFKHYITKPIKVSEFIRTVEETLDCIKKPA